MEPQDDLKEGRLDLILSSAPNHPATEAHTYILKICSCCNDRPCNDKGGRPESSRRVSDRERMEVQIFHEEEVAGGNNGFA